MATGQLNGVLDNLRRTAFLHGADCLSDAALLSAFIASGEESAFEGLVRRHGPMVFGVCRRILSNIHDAEDAFQAAFLVLAKKAATVKPRALVGNWLYGVAYRTALKARSMIAKRHAREKQVNDMPECEDRAVHPSPFGRGDGGEGSDLQPLIDAELNRLADKYRVPVVLCDLEGKSQRDAAKELGWPEGTLMTRLSRAREMLAKRLTRKGVALSAGALAALFAQGSASAAVPAPLAVSTVKAAALFAAGQSAAMVSAKVAVLTEGVLHTMFIAKIKGAAILLFAVAVLGTTGGFFTHWSLTERSVAGERRPTNPPAVERAAAADQDQERGREGRDPANVTGKIVGVAKDGKSISIETPATERGGAPGKQDYKLTDKTELTFSGVGLGGATLKEGMLANIWLADGAKDTAAKIHVGGRTDGRIGPDFSGKVTSVSMDGVKIRFEIASRNRREGADAEVREIKLTISTMQTFSNIAKGGAKATEGYLADVWLERGSKTDAVAIAFRAGEEGERRDRARLEIRPDASGKVVAVAKDGKVVTLETPAKERGQPAEKVDVKLTDKSRVTYVNVGPNGDTPTEGYLAHIVFVENSKDTAATVTFLAPHKERLQTHRGLVSEVGKDGKSFTIEIPPTERGQPPEKLTIKITEHTRVTFNGVGLNGAKLTDGYTAQIWLDEGSRDAAFQVILGRAEVGSRRE